MRYLSHDDDDDNNVNDYTHIPNDHNAINYPDQDKNVFTRLCSVIKRKTQCCSIMEKYYHVNLG